MRTPHENSTDVRGFDLAQDVVPRDDETFVTDSPPTEKNAGLPDGRGNRNRWIDVSAALLTLALFGARLLQIPDPVSGLDPGNWLAFAAELFGASLKASHETAYPPLLPLLVRLALVVAPPMTALRLVAALISLVPGIAAFLLLRVARLGWLALFGLAFSATGYTSEMLAWGGYPQLLAAGLFLLSLAALVHAFQTDARSGFVWCGVAAGGCLLTSQLVGMQVAAAITSSLIFWGLLARPGWRRWLTGSAILGLATFVTSTPALPIYLNFVHYSGKQAFNSQGFHALPMQIAYVVGDSPLLWAALFAGIVLAWSNLVQQREWPLGSILTGLVVSSLGLTALTLEVRFLHILQAAGIVALAIFVPQLISELGDRRIVRLLVTGAATGLIIVMTILGMLRYNRAAPFYQVLDPSYVAGLDWLRASAQPGDLAASTTTRNNWPIGWWVEGLGHVPTLIDSDPHWVAFTEEKTQAQIARQIFSAPRYARAAAIAREYGVTLLIIDTRDNNRFNLWEDEAHGNIPGIVYRNSRLTILRLASPGSASRPTIPSVLIPTP